MDCIRIDDVIGEDVICDEGGLNGGGVVSFRHGYLTIEAKIFDLGIEDDRGEDTLLNGSTFSGSEV